MTTPARELRPDDAIWDSIGALGAVIEILDERLTKLEGNHDHTTPAHTPVARRH